MSFKQFDEFGFAENEKQVLAKWLELDVYQKLIERSQDGPQFRFMDGPPFVSGDLHHGHMLVSMIKDSVLRFMRMRGYNVLNKIGYDCHGLPVEMKVNAELGVSTREDVLALGLDVYNQTCKDFINRYAGSWEPVFNQIGRWVDFDNEYKTMDWKFMESVWWSFQQLFEKGLVYRGYRIMAYSTPCETPLSNFEAKSNMQEITDMSVYVKFKAIQLEDTYLIAWTTTPWTLPSNLALAVNPNMSYVQVRDHESENTYFVANDCLLNLYPMTKKDKKNPDYVPPYTVTSEFMGSDMLGMLYEPLFSYFADGREFRVIGAEYVTAESGTGIVHQAPSHGEDDFNVCIENEVVTIESVGDYCPLDHRGCFTDKVPDFEGLLAREANVHIISKLKEKDMLIRKEMYKHNYPLCPRTDTPLIYMAVSSFFIRVTEIKDQLIENNKKVNWIPKNIGENRFHKWLEGTKDWGVSRSRFFGTPIPVWTSDDGLETVCIGSIQELVDRAGLDYLPQDLHLESIGHIQIPSQEGRGNLKLVGDVFDCWYESGSVPFAQYHYPFEGNADFFDGEDYLSEFICEGVDQTRGWFYTLLVLSTAIFGKPAYKNVICSGLINGSDGKKISKRLQNYTPLNEVLDIFGSDAIRLYLISSPAVRAESFKFIDEDINKIKRRLFQYFNCVKFFIEHAHTYEANGHVFDTEAWQQTTNFMDKWILSRIGSLVTNINSHMDDLKVHKVKYEIFEFIEDLANWYVKFNRPRIRGRFVTPEEQGIALSTLYRVIIAFCQATAPFIPYLTETVYQRLVNRAKVWDDSIHMCQYPDPVNYSSDPIVDRKMLHLQQVAKGVRSIRSSNAAIGGTRKPVSFVKIGHEDPQFVEDLNELKEYVITELNCLDLHLEQVDGFVSYSLQPNMKAIGQKYRGLAKKLCQEIRNVNHDVIMDYKRSGDQLVINMEDVEYTLLDSEYHIVSQVGVQAGQDEYVNVHENILIIVNNEQTDQVKETYLRRLFINAVQNMRKNTELHPWDQIGIYYQTESPLLNDLLVQNADYLKEQLMYGIMEGAGSGKVYTEATETLAYDISVRICITDGLHDKSI